MKEQDGNFVLGVLSDVATLITPEALKNSTKGDERFALLSRVVTAAVLVQENMESKHDRSIRA